MRPAFTVHSPMNSADQSIDERARHLPLDLRGIDGISRIGRCDDAVDLHLVAIDRDLGAGCHIAAERHGLRQAAEYALRRRPTPSGLLRHRIEHGEMLGMVCHQLAAELERVNARFLGKLVHEAFEIDGVVVDVHAAPEARIDVRVAHGMVHQDVGDRVAERRFVPAGIEA